MATGAAIGGAVGGTTGLGTALAETTNNCLAHDCLSIKWDEHAPGYHKYTLETPPLCNVAEAGCMAAVQAELLRYSAPYENPESLEPLKIGVQVRDVELVGNNFVSQYAPNANVVINGTRGDHLFDNGYIMREIKVDISGNVTIFTTGEGVNNPLPVATALVSPVLLSPAVRTYLAVEINQSFGRLIFHSVGIENLNHIKAALNPRSP